MPRPRRSIARVAVTSIMLGVGAFFGVRLGRPWMLSSSGKAPPSCSNVSLGALLPADGPGTTTSAPGPGAETGSAVRPAHARGEERVRTHAPAASVPTPVIDEWDSVPLGDGRNLGRYVSAFQQALHRSPAMDGVRANCVYEGVYRPEGSDPTIVVLNLRTTTSGITVERASIRHVGILDEYQQKCVVEWLSGAALDIPGVEPGKSLRVTYPMRLGAVKPRSASPDAPELRK